LTYVMNNLSRGLGLSDNYPFVLSSTVIQKLRFIYDTIDESRPAAARVSSSTRPLNALGRAALIAAGAAAVVGLVWWLQDTRRPRGLFAERSL
jgi:ferric-dicitrate binding protein FerR (iron transport regulator)